MLKILFSFAVIIGLLYFFAMAYSEKFDSKSTHKPGKNVLFVLAHPDDETV